MSTTVFASVSRKFESNAFVPFLLNLEQFGIKIIALSLSITISGCQYQAFGTL